MCSKEIELLRHVLQTGEVKNPSKVTKDTLMAVIKYMVPKICDPTLNAKLVQDLTAPATDDWSSQDNAAANEDDIFSNSQETTQEDSPKTEARTQLDRPKLCKSRWTGSTCEDANCERAHPSYCKEDNCKERRNPNCLLWHTIRNKKSGNGEKRAAAPSGPKSGFSKQGSKFLGKKSLELQLLSSQLEVYKAKEKIARISRARPTKKTYAEVTAAAPSLCTTPTQPQPTQSATPVHPNNVGHLVNLLTAVLSTLQGQARL